MTIGTATLGKSNVQVSTLGTGTVPLAGFNVAVPYDEFEKVVLAAYAGGVRYFDTAPMYGLGKAEHHLGHALRALGIRDKVVVSTKCGRVLKPASRTPVMNSIYGIEWVDPFPFRDTYDYTYDGVMRSFEDSQARLGLDYIDIFLVHDVGRAWHGDQSEFYWNQLRESGYRALDELRSSGAVGALGLGVNETESVVGVAKEFPIDCSMIAGRYTLLNHAPLGGDFEELKRRNVSVIAAGVYNSGVLATGSGGTGQTYDYQNAPDSIMRRVRQLENVCKTHGVSLRAAATQFVAAHPAVATVVQGAKSVSEVVGNLENMDARIAPAFWQDLKAQELIPSGAPVPSAV